jgi:hypothetical protein
MKLPARVTSMVSILAVWLAFAPVSCFAAATLTQEIDPAQTNVGDPVTVTLNVQGGTLATIQLPTVDGLQTGETRMQIKSEENDNGGFVTLVSLSITIMPERAGDFIIPAFDLHTEEGDVLHVKAMKLRVLSNPNAPATTVTAKAVPSTPTANPNGPVVMPPPNTVTAPAAAQNAIAPRDADGGPAKVFIIITPQTTNAYVGQSIPLSIDFYIRMDVNAEQNSLPTIKGSDFLMNSFTTRGHQNVGFLEGRQYIQESWLSAIAATKSGDFPLSMERDTYWVKSFSRSTFDPFSPLQADLAHQSISSNQLTIHVSPLPTEGQPPHFTGAIGQFSVTADAQPQTVDIGEPVILHFTVSGEGNFDYVHCPVLASDPAWKTYTPKSSTNYLDESRTHAIKSFEQSVIALKNQSVPLPPANFSYFDPTAKQYVTVPIALPVIEVSGSPLPLASALPDDGSNLPSTSAAPKADDFLPNRADIGTPQLSLAPIYRQPWFWGVQTALISLPAIGALLLFLRFRSTPDDDRAMRALQRSSIQREQDAMTEAVQQKDSVAFFLAARHAIQLQLGAQWAVKPEALTLGEIRRRDPELAETLTPLFTQADEVIYSGNASTGLDLAQWEQRVRTELLQPQPA